MRAFWKLLDEDDQQHLRVDADVQSEEAFWWTRAWQIAEEQYLDLDGERSEASGDHPHDDLLGRATVCRQCRNIELIINNARSKETT